MEDVKKYLAMIGEELEEPNNLSKDWVRLLMEMRALLEAKQAGRMILLPEQGQTLYFIGRYDCERCPVADACSEMRGLEKCPDYIDTDVWKWDKSQGWEEGSQLDIFMSGQYLLTWEDALAALKKARALCCADCDYWRRPDADSMHRCACAGSEWAGKITSYGNSCSHLVPRGCAAEEQHE